MAKSGQKLEFAINQFVVIENQKYFMGVLLDQVPTTNLRMRAVLEYFGKSVVQYWRDAPVSQMRTLKNLHDRGGGVLYHLRICRF